MLTLANLVTVLGVLLTGAGATFVYLLGDTTNARSLIYALGAITVTGTTAILLELIYRAGSPLSPDRSGAGRDEAWRFLTAALLLWGGSALVTVPGTVLASVATHTWLPGHPGLCVTVRPSGGCGLGPAYFNGVVILQTLLSTLNNWLFFRSILRIHLDRPLAVVEWLRGPALRTIDGGFVVAAVLLFVLQLFTAMNASAILAGGWDFLVSLSVLGLYGLALTRAFRERGLRTFEFAWWTALGLQALVQMVTLLSAIDSERFAWAARIPIQPMSLTAEALWCLSLVAQAASWFAAQATSAAHDLAELRGWLKQLRQDVHGSPLADELDDAVAITERHRPDLLEARKLDE